VTITERELEITLPKGVSARKFDTHPLSHCMKAVDFIVELDDRIFFIEIKDPDCRGSVGESRDKEYIDDFSSGKLDEKLKTKFRDSFLYEWASDRTKKPIYYLVLIGAESLDNALLLACTDRLKRLLPVDNRPSEWTRDFVAGCAVSNIAAWNNQFPRFPARRVGA